MAFRDAVEGYSRSRAFYYISSEGRRMDLTAILKFSPTESHTYICGPPELLDSVRETAAGLGLMPEQLHLESLGAPFASARLRVSRAMNTRLLNVSAPNCAES
jgi:ferredoxin-NADP reductase